MPWFTNLIPESIKKSVCSCLIKRYLSHFIENEITRDQLNLDLYNGRATAERISLAVEALNELGEEQNWPIEFVDGYIDKIHISVPWTSIFSDSTEVEICGLKITFQPKQRQEDATSMFESMWNSMTSSMHLAEQFAKEEAGRKQSNTPVFEGIELFAQTIDTVVRRIKVKFVDSIFQIEHLPKESDNGVGLVMKIKFMEYFDDYSTESAANEDAAKEDSNKAYLIDSFTTKNVILKGVELFTVEFSSGDRTYSRSLIRDDSRESSKESETFFEAGESNCHKETGSDDDTNASSNEDNPVRHEVLCGKCFNNQEVKVRLKQSENISGPKVSIEVNLGSLIVFLSPRQFKVLLELVEGFSSPDLEDNSNVFHKNVPQPRPMTDKDYEIVEEQLAQMTSNKHLQAFNLTGGHGWATGAMDESGLSEYLLMGDGSNEMIESTMSAFSSSIDSSMTSSMVSSVTENTSHTRRRGCNIDADPTAEISHFQVRVATFALILLHEDLLTHSMTNDKLLVWQMRTVAEKFFDTINLDTLSGLMGDGFEQVHQSLEPCCALSHLRFLAAPLKIEGNETTTSSAFSISGDLTASKLEISECLVNEGLRHVPLLSFEAPQSAGAPSSAKPNLALKVKHIQRTGKGAGLGRRGGPKTELSLHLDKCSVEFDLSIVDRISALLNHTVICTPAKKDAPAWPAKQAAACSTGVTVKCTKEVKVACPLLNFKIRFPIPDFRPATDMSKPPWWERNVRPDYLTLVLHNGTFQTVFQTGQSFSEYNIECKLLDIFYYESENSAGLHVGRSGREEKYLSSMQTNLPLTKLSIKIYPKKAQEDEEDDVSDPMTHSFYGVFENQGNPEPGPFGTKRVVHESDTPHNKERKDDPEEQILPGDKAELKEFVESTTSNAEILVEVTLPVVSLQLVSKHVYELIYNRINNDLLLWEAQAPRPATAKTCSRYTELDEEEATQGRFMVANSGFQSDSDSDTSDDEGAGSNVFYSTYDSKMRQSPKSPAAPTRKNSQSNFVMSLNIAEGVLSLCPPVRDSTSNVIPGQQGELLLNLSNANVFIVSGYKGNKNLGYVCVQVNNAQLYHCDIQTAQSANSPLKEVGAIPGTQLFPTVYPSDQKSLICSQNRGGDREMFTVAVKIEANHETHHVKVITVSLAINQATLRHRMGREPNSWISHLIDFFNVQDHPLSGYVPKDVLTELHLHLWDCAIDYRPLHIPLRSVITLGSFSISSHLTAVANTSTLRLIFEDCGMFLSEKLPPRDGVASIVKVDLPRDYVNVMEIALLEISIKTTDKQSGLNPHIDLRTSINMLNIRTCADSGRALFQLLTYYINDGDLTPEPQPGDSAGSSPHRAMEEELLSMERQDSTISQSQQDQIAELLEEAMEESPKSSKTQSTFPQAGAKLFYFPDERETFEDVPSHSIPQVAADLGDVKGYHFGGGKDHDTDDDFCFVGDDAMFPKDGVPEITWFSQDVKILENHIAKPDGKKDVLAPPKGFPTPVTRYTLCDMTIVWQIYGGNDFKRKVKDAKKEVRFAEQQHLGDRVTFSNTTNKVDLSRAQDPTTKGLSWIQRGGANRDHAVLMELQLSKVRFCHEVYPETVKQASRQVLSIFDVEIRDRLASSQINKFLYQYSSHSLPKQSQSNMVLIKALHSRPDRKLKREECDLKIALLPIRLNIDQDSLFFMIRFFKELSGENPDDPNEAAKDSSHSTPTHQPPVMSVSRDSEALIKERAKQVVTENLIMLESKYQAAPEEDTESNASTVTDDSPIYFRFVEFSKDVLIRLDYVAKRMDLSYGSIIPGILMGLGHLNCSEIRLKRIVHRHGLLGPSKLIGFLLQEWITDIKRNQLSTILVGVGPMKAFIQLFQGIKDLFWLPIEQYQKDGRIVRGLQRGANSFTTSTAMAALELTTRIIYFIQITAETAYDMLSPGPSIRMKRLAKRKGRRKRYQQPQDIREGITNACMVVKEGIGETADNILQVATMEKEQKGISGAVGAVIRQIPSTILEPILIASQATTNVLGGVQSQLVPDARKEANEKWRGDL